MIKGYMVNQKRLNVLTVLQIYQHQIITRHIQNIFKTEELDKDSVCSYFEHTASDGKKIQYYNLNMIISVGYRVNSKKATSFRRWATSILKDYMINGYTVNQIRDILPVL